MTVKDKKAITVLLNQGYIVVIDDLDGMDFNQRYSVYQGVGWGQLKAVVCDKNGKAIALQG